LYLDPCFNREEPSRSVGLRWLISRRDKEDLYSPHRNPEAWECAGARPSASGLFFGFCFCATVFEIAAGRIYSPASSLFICHAQTFEMGRAGHPLRRSIQSRRSYKPQRYNRQSSYSSSVESAPANPCQRWPVSNRVWRHDPRQARAQFQMRLFFSLSAICCLLRGPMTAIWCGEAGIPSNVSVGENDCSWTWPDPRTEIWCGLMGKPATSYCGSCCANAGPVSNATIATADSASFVVNKFIFYFSI
jgi:hypothetical protein